MNKKSYSWLGRVMLLIVCFRFSCFALTVGETFVIFKDKYIPLFEKEGAKFEYEVGSHGINCYDLGTVLPPGTFVKVLNEEKTAPCMFFVK